LVAPAHAADPNTSTPLDEAKELFRSGLALLGAGDTERALEYFLRSRALVPSSKNTVNAAICLERLGRQDEALEMYEEVLARFAGELDDQDRANLGPVMAALREHLGYLELTSNVDGLVVIDGRPRGRLPLSAPLRLLPGTRSMRIVKDGYRTFQRSLEVAAGRTASLDAELEPLAGSGAIRVEDRAGVELDLFVDGRRIGSTPWEGILPKGRHVIQVLHGDIGSNPELVEVLEGKTLLVRVKARPLTGPLTISSEPASAHLFVDDVPLARGRWAGRLPLGRHRLRAAEPGYFSESRSLELRAAQPSQVHLRLVRDSRHPRWPQPTRFRFDIGVRAGPVYASDLNGGMDSSCPGLCAGDRAAWGATGAVAVGVDHDSGFGAELLAGYWVIHRRFARAVFDSWQEAMTTYALEQALDGRGPFAALRGRIRRSTSLGVDLFSTVGLGAVLATYTTEASGVAWTNAAAIDVRSSGAQEVRAVTPFVATSLGVERRFDRLSVHLAVGAWFFPLPGPRFSGPEIGVPLDCEPGVAPLGSVGCAPESSALAGEPAHGPFWAITPELGAEYRF
jgi:hypothetical protein